MTYCKHAIVVYVVAALAIPAVLCHAQQVGASIPAEYVGDWKGVSGKMTARQTVKNGLAKVTRDLGHEITEFELTVGPDGTITGSGTASYYFNVDSDANLIVTRARHAASLVGGTQAVGFRIDGTMTADDRVQLKATPDNQLTLRIDDKTQPMDAWNVFGPDAATVREEERKFVIEASYVLAVAGMKMELEWTAERPNRCGELAAEIEFLEQKYLPFIEYMIETYERARNDREVWGELDAQQVNEWVLAEVRKKYPDAEVGAETARGGDGAAETTIFGSDEPYPYVLDWRKEHEQYHRRRHVAREEAMFNSLPYQQFVRWFLGAEADTYKNINQKRAVQKLEELKRECREKCAASCCGSAP